MPGYVGFPDTFSISKKILLSSYREISNIVSSNNLDSVRHDSIIALCLSRNSRIVAEYYINAIW